MVYAADLCLVVATKVPKLHLAADISSVRGQPLGLSLNFQSEKQKVGLDGLSVCSFLFCISIAFDELMIYGLFSLVMIFGVHPDTSLEGLMTLLVRVLTARINRGDGCRSTIPYEHVGPRWHV